MSNLRHALNIKEVGVVVSAIADQAILAEVLFDRNYRRFALEIENTGSNALDALVLQGKTHADGNWFALAAAWGTASEVLRYTVGALESLASAAKGQALVDVEGLYSIRIRGSAAAGGAEVTVAGALT